MPEIPDPELRQRVLMEPGTAYILPNGNMMIAFENIVYTYSGPNFNDMTLEEINEYIERMDRRK